MVKTIPNIKRLKKIPFFKNDNIIYNTIYVNYKYNESYISIIMRRNQIQI